MREIAVVFDPERKLFLYSALVFVVVGVGPFGTYDALALWDRMIFWSLDILGCMVIVVPILHVFYHSRLVRGIPSLPRFMTGIALGAFPAAGYITLLFAWVAPEVHFSTPYPLLVVQVIGFSSALLLVEYVLWPRVFSDSADRRAALIPALATGVQGGGIALAPLAEDRDPPAETVRRVPLLDRLPPDHRNADILSISMQDHYAEVTTSVGTTLVLMRLTDVMALLGDLPGARVHRSHWVARDSVAGIERTGRRHEVVLTDGRRLPVGNTYLSAVRNTLEGR